MGQHNSSNSEEEDSTDASKIIDKILKNFYNNNRYNSQTYDVPETDAEEDEKSKEYSKISSEKNTQTIIESKLNRNDTRNASQEQKQVEDVIIDNYDEMQKKNHLTDGEIFFKKPESTQEEFNQLFNDYLFTNYSYTINNNEDLYLINKSDALNDNTLIVPDATTIHLELSFSEFKNKLRVDKKPIKIPPTQTKEILYHMAKDQKFKDRDVNDELTKLLITTIAATELDIAKEKNPKMPDDLLNRLQQNLATRLNQESIQTPNPTTDDDRFLNAIIKNIERKLRPEQKITTKVKSVFTAIKANHLKNSLIKKAKNTAVSSANVAKKITIMR
jgi:hypothetical protein